MRKLIYGLPFVAAILFASVAGAWPIQDEEIAYQNQNFRRWWGTDLVWRFEELPVDGTVPKHRYPYSGAIYPDNAGGTAYVLRKYDRAFHRGRRLAESFEYHDIQVHQERTTVSVRGGFFGGRVFQQTRVATPHWAGHCNGWAAAAIRHAEPQRNVTRNGVVFTPADIKGLLAELYVYSEIEHLGGIDRAINPGTLHVVLSNWLGRNQYPIAMDSSVGKEVWNYPIYAYRSSNAKRRNQKVEVKVNLGYVNYVNREFDSGPQNYRYLYFHYTLDLDDGGNITGGNYHYDSNQLDMLWVPLMPTPGGEEGNEPGNPHLDVDEVLALWRDSVDTERRAQWFTIDPAAEDRVQRETLAEVADETEMSEAVTAAQSSETQSSETEPEPSEAVAATTEPATTEPATTEPATTEPATTEPRGESVSDNSEETLGDQAAETGSADPQGEPADGSEETER